MRNSEGRPASHQQRQRRRPWHWLLHIHCAALALQAEAIAIASARCGDGSLRMSSPDSILMRSLSSAEILEIHQELPGRIHVVLIQQLVGF
jgi:hypothetical protein